MTAIIKCNDINYRQGYIEVTPNIHTGYINIEVWKIDPEFDIEHLSSVRDIKFPDTMVSSQVELELNREQAENLIAQLQRGLENLKGKY